MGGGGCRECPNPCRELNFEDEPHVKAEHKSVGGLSLVAVACLALDQVKIELRQEYSKVQCKLNLSGSVPMLRFHMDELTEQFADKIRPFLTEGGKTSLSTYLAHVQRTKR
ncbi:MAG TPA: hypothetical protein VNU93_07490 [Verrucomicrobiae bacterium]|nr:hypothetical protein [Verrucomicrobiae bacterium]